MNGKLSFFQKPASILLSLLLILIGSLLGNSIQTDHGNVTVSDVRFVGDNGNLLSGFLYTPTNMNPKHPLPAVLTEHGYINSREVQDAFDIEFARRGYVVLSMDMEGHGYSSQTPYDPTQRGALAGLSYLRNLAFVNKDQVALEGHSMGGWSVLSAAGAKPEWVRTVIQEGSSPETFGTPKVLANTPFNYGIVYSKYDEFSQLMWGVPKAEQVNQTPKMEAAFGTTDPVIPGKVYGSFANKSAREFFQPPVIHPIDHWSEVAVGDAIDFLQQSMPAPHPMDPSDQVWRYKEYGTFLTLLAGVALLLAVGGNLLRTRYFQPLASSTQVQGKGIQGRLSYGIGVLIATAIPAITFFKFQTLGSTWFPASAFWPESLTNGFVVWVVFNAVIALVLFGLWHKYSNAKNGANSVHYGLSFSNETFSINWNLMGRTALFAIYSVGILYLVTLVMDAVFHLDMRIWVIGLKVLDFHHFVIVLKYLVPFLLFFLVNGLILHGQFRQSESSSESRTAWKWFFSSFLINTLGIIVLIVMQYAPLFANDQLFWPAQSLLGIVAFQFVPVNLTVSLVSTFFFRKTGRIYAGAFINTLLITWFIVAGQAIQFVH